ncbi:acyclic terpene utilization AtuA family protein [Pseudarthrobacter sp. J75]|uniref:acyclic terpene utilization AtuA family protein n=1 Tax=unclassified Pseudarthrobacter TaxID=2647000 RepID=UPI002E814C70|nr:MULTISPECIES: acyclic terpene utilization AtuA family protein [unclassified Pseudarthrobacter]MEE2522444.1 acyclic terpene utilization AtuA family protein [Pseudarthrobacter sp. J47]MEE2529225.1 acyclic terpene utilization AtuA family protein [Pseudarthrobacter sp. J75]
MTKSLKYLVPVGGLGGGFTEEHFTAALTADLDFIAVDSGSTDGGPSALGQDHFLTSRGAMKRDLRLLIKATRQLDIPLLVGSSGGSGGNKNLEGVWEIVREIAEEEKLSFRTALIPSEPDRATLVRKFREGRIKPLRPAPPINESTLTDTHRIVAMMGPEPFIEALQGGADVVLGGRSSDAAFIAAVPLMRGMSPGPAWHAAKIMECGGAAVTQMVKPEGMICTLTDEYFELEPVSPEQSCSPLSVAAHALYETSNPVVMVEPGGIMNLKEARYEAVSDRAVRVWGSRFDAAPYTVKLEGAALQGYRSASLGGITDPTILRDFDKWFEAAKGGADFTLRRGLGDELADQCSVTYRVYGRNAVLGANETREFGNDHEAGVLIDVLAPTQEMANSAIKTLSHTILHYAVPQWHGLVSNLAFPFSPHDFDLGPSYSFVLNHVVELDDPMELYSIRYEEV